jgi:hypothetical protein
LVSYYTGSRHRRGDGIKAGQTLEAFGVAAVTIIFTDAEFGALDTNSLRG